MLGGFSVLRLKLRKCLGADLKLRRAVSQPPRGVLITLVDVIGHIGA